MYRLPLAQIEVMEGRPEEVLRRIEQVLEDDPDLDLALAMKGLALFRLGKGGRGREIARGGSRCRNPQAPGSTRFGTHQRRSRPVRGKRCGISRRPKSWELRASPTRT